MPNDFQVLEQIRGVERDDPVPILVTAYQFTRDEAIAAIQHGADDLIILPFTPEQLMQKVAGVTNGVASNLEEFR
jgi:CheY-like chemotaxis protein